MSRSTVSAKHGIPSAGVIWQRAAMPGMRRSSTNRDFPNGTITRRVSSRSSEQAYGLGGKAPRRSFRDAKIQRLENTASETGVGLAVLTSAKTEQRLKRDAEQRRAEEERQRRERAARIKHIEDRRTAGSFRNQGEQRLFRPPLAALDRPDLRTATRNQLRFPVARPLTRLVSCHWERKQLNMISFLVISRTGHGHGQSGSSEEPSERIVGQSRSRRGSDRHSPRPSGGPYRAGFAPKTSAKVR